MTSAPRPKHPFRDSAILYGAMAAVTLFVVWLTGGRLWPRFDTAHRTIGALAVVAACFLLATGYAWWRIRQRRERERRGA